MKRKSINEMEFEPLTEDVQKSQGRAKSIFDDAIVFKNNEEIIKLLAYAISSINECVSITDKNNNLVFVNDAFVKTYGFSREELIGKSIDIVTCSNSLISSTETIRTATIQEGWIGELMNKKKDGTEFPISLSTAVVHDNNGVPIALIGIASDITEQKQRELILKESEERYKSIFHNSNAVMMLIDPETGKIFDANNSACEYYGYTKEQITSLKITDINTASPNIIKKELTKAATKIKNYFLFRHKLANGQIRDVEVYSGVIEINGKRFLHSIIHDITEKKEIEKALQLEQELFIGGPVTVFKWKAVPESPTEYVSPNVKNTLGYDPEEFLSNSVNFKQLIHPDDAQRISTEIKNYVDDGIFNFEQQYRVRNKNGFYRWYFDFTRVIINDEAKVIAYHTYLFDNTPQKEAEEALQTERELFIGGPVVTIRWQTNISGGIKYVSPNVLMMLGYKPEELLDQNFNYHNIIHQDDLNRVILEVKQCVKNEQDVYEQEYRIQKKEGQYIWVHDFTKTTRDQKNNIIDLRGYLIDITSRKETEEYLLRSEHELRKTNKMKDKFFSIISHDLRSPFQGLIGMANILVEDDQLTNEERDEFTQKLYEGLKNQFNFIEDLLAWNRVQRGAIEFNPTHNDLSHLIKETLSLLNNSIENKKLNLICNLPEKILAQFDKDMVATIIRNLLSNAIKFTHKGGIIKVSAEEFPELISVHIQDTGIGITENDLKKLWGIDSHYTTKGTDGEGGTGLGLILCKDFVDKHGGTISVQSKINKGSTFSFSIPKNHLGSSLK